MNSAPVRSPQFIADPIGNLSSRLTTAIWVYDFDNSRIIWANSAGLSVWRADNIEDLAARDLSLDMTVAVARRLRQYQTDLVDPECSFKEVWTLYPNNEPQTLRVNFKGITLDDGRLAMLCEGTVDEVSEPDALRSAQALLHTPVNISLYGSAGEVLYLNPAARSTRTELKLGLVERFCNQRQGEAFLAELEATGVNQVVARVHTDDGDRWFEIRASRCMDSVTGTAAYLVSELDVTELKEAEEKAGKADRAKSEFLANMSHELRTPLNAIIGFSDFMLNGNLGPSVPEKFIEYVSDIHESGQHLLRLINDVLDLAKVETGEMPVDLERVNLSKTFTAVERMMSANAESAGVTLRFNTPELDCDVTADELRLRQVLANLLSNGIKFTDAGGIVSVSAFRSGKSISIVVRDTGIGMTPSEVEESLQAFRQVDNSISRRFEGTGLGLPLSKSLTESQGGSLHIHSEPGQGTEVTVKLSAASKATVALARTG